MRTHRFALAPLGILALCYGLACTDTIVTVVDVASVEVSPASATVQAGETVQLEARVRDADGNLLAGRQVTWASDDPRVATVNQTGRVRGEAAGRTAVTATSEGVRGAAAIDVVVVPAIRVEPAAVDLLLVLGDSELAAASVAITNGGGGELADLSVSTSYGAAASGWLTTSLSGSTAPATLDVSVEPGGLGPGAYTATVSIAAPAASNSPVQVPVSLEVVRPNPAPSLNGIDPASAQREETLDVRLDGDNFVDGITVADFGERVAVNRLVVHDPTSITAEISIERTAALGRRDVSVRNPPPGGGVATIEDGFEIRGANPFPTVTAVEPDSGQRQASLDVVVSGSGFLDGLTTVGFGTGITVHGVTVDSETALTANLTVAADAPLGPRDVSVSNPAPGGGIATRPDAFTVVPANPAPTLSSVAPDSGHPRDTLDIAIAGSGFRPVTTVGFGAGIEVAAVTVVDAASLIARIAIDSAAALGPRSVSVTNPPPGGGTAVLDDAFTVIAGNPDPTVGSIQPGSARIGTAVASTIQGSGFVEGLTTVEVDHDVTVPLLEVHDSSTMIAFVLVSLSAQPGPRDVVIRNPPPGGGSAIAEDGFIVIGPVSAATSSVSASPAAGVAADGVDVSSVTVAVRDAVGSAIPGIPPAQFDVAVTGSASAGAVQESGTDGVYVFPVTNTVVEPVTVSVAVEGVAIDQTAGIQFVAGTVSAAHSTVSASPTSDVVADGSAASTVTVELRDSQGNPITAVPPADFAVGLSGSGNAAATAVTETATPGTYAFAVTSTRAESVTISVSARGVALAQQPSVQFVHGAAAALQLDGSTADLPAGTARQLNATLLDAFGNVVDTGAQASATVTFAQTDGTGSVAGLGSVPASAGVAAIAVTGESAGPVTISATSADPVLASGPLAFSVVPGPVSVPHSSVGASPVSGVLADGNDAATVTVQLSDAAGNPISGAAIGIDLTGDAVAHGLAESSPGTYTFAVTNTTAETVTVTVTADGVTLEPQPTIEFVPAP